MGVVQALFDSQMFLKRMMESHSLIIPLQIFTDKLRYAPILISFAVQMKMRSESFFAIGAICRSDSDYYILNYYIS